MRVRLGRRYRFQAAHRLHQAALDDAENAALFGVCARPHGHGLTLLVTVEGALDQRADRVVDPAALDRVVDGVLAPLDHVRLDVNVPALAGAPATAEATIAHLHRELAPAVAALGVELVRLDLEETNKNRFETERIAG